MTDISIAKNKTDKHLFEIRLDWLEHRRGILSANDVRDTVRVTTPKSFGGDGEEWSPEHLFLGSISSCYMTTFLALAVKMNFEISHYECHAIGMIEMIEGKYRFTQADLYPKVSITDESQREKVRLALEKSQRYCLVSNSVNFRIIYHPEILRDRHPLHRSISELS